MLACRTCGGVFVGIELALRLLAVLKADVPPRVEGAPSVACPVCRAAMRCALPAGVEARVEVCRRHGVWFQDQDLVLVTRAVAKELGKPVPEVVASLDVPARNPQRGRPPAQPSLATSQTAPSPGAMWSYAPIAPGGVPSSNYRMSVGERAGHTALDVVDTGVGIVGDVADVAIGVVSLPVELSLAIVGGLGSLFD